MRRPLAPSRKSDRAASRRPSAGPAVIRAASFLALGVVFGFGAAAQALESRAVAAAASPRPGGKVYHTRFKVDAADGIREVDIEGSVRFSADESRIEWMSGDARFHVVTLDAGQKVRISAEPDAQGRPVVQIQMDGRERPFDQAAEHRLAQTLPVVFRELGHHVEARVQAAYAAGGAPAVYGMIATIRSDNATRLHYDTFLHREGLSDDEISGALSRVGEDFQSDSELAMFLYGAADLYRERPAIRESFLACLAAINADVERLRVTRNLFGVDAIPEGEQPTIALREGDC